MSRCLIIHLLFQEILFYTKLTTTAEQNCAIRNYLVHLMERNGRIFITNLTSRLSDRIVFLASLWCHAAWAFGGTSLTDRQMDWSYYSCVLL